MIVLGPVPCQGCRLPVYWDGFDWMRGKHRHVCRPGSVHAIARVARHRSLARARATWDNDRVGISDASPDIMCDALLVADTSREGVPRLEVSAP